MIFDTSKVNKLISDQLRSLSLSCKPKNRKRVCEAMLVNAHRNAIEIMPPTVGMIIKTLSSQNLRLMANTRREFSNAEIFVMQEYVESIFTTIGNPEATEQQKQLAVARVLVLGHVVGACNDHIIHAGIAEQTPEYIEACNGVVNATLKFADDVKDRAVANGTIEFKEANQDEVFEISKMMNSLLKAIYVGDWYTAWEWVFINRVLYALGGRNLEAV